MKLVCTVVHKYTPDFVPFILQCKCACELQDVLVRTECFENFVDVLVIFVLEFTYFCIVSFKYTFSYLLLE